MWKKAKLKDIPELSQIFFSILDQHPSYVSHGEMQMGITNESGKILEGAEDRWKNYIKRKIQNRSRLYPSVVFKYTKMKKIIAFGVFMLNSDEYKKFGVVCDMIVHKKFRRHGLGEELLLTGLKWFEKYGIKDIYLESGIKNYSAHRFYERRHFEKTSYVFKLKS